MPLPNAAIQSIVARRTFTYATLWKIIRSDAVEKYFTNHNREITYPVNNGNLYTPVGGFNASARQRPADLDPRNLEFRGVFTANRISIDDLQAGLYNESQVFEYLISYREPWAGPVYTSKYWFTSIDYDGYNWVAKIEGLGRWLKNPAGRVCTRKCDFVLGDANTCGFDLEAKATTVTESVSTVDANLPRMKFTSTALIGNGVKEYDYGFLVWITGPNAGIRSEVKSFNDTTGEVVLQHPLRKDIVSTPTADTFKIRAGCDLLYTTCINKFANVANFGGFPFLPNSNKVQRTNAF